MLLHGPHVLVAGSLGLVVLEDTLHAFQALSDGLLTVPVLVGRSTLEVDEVIPKLYVVVVWSLVETVEEVGRPDVVGIVKLRELVLVVEADEVETEEVDETLPVEVGTEEVDPDDVLPEVFELVEVDPEDVLTELFELVVLLDPELVDTDDVDPEEVGPVVLLD